jgi:hypothetical protein
MNEYHSSMPSMYQGIKKRKTGIQKPLLAVLVFILVLLVIRILNLGLWWLTNRLEIQNNAVLSNTQYTFIGFSSEAGAKKELEKIRDFGKGDSVAVSYFDVFTPIGIMVHNRQQGTEMIDMGRLLLYTCPGSSSTKFFFHGAITQDCGGKVSEKYYEPYLAQRPIRLAANKLRASSAGGPALSFIQKPVAKSEYLRVPYLIYFYFPLVLIILLSLHFGGGMLTGFFYFVELFFLFDYRQVLAEVPFAWVKSITGGEFGMSAATIVAVVVAALALILFASGLYRWKTLREHPAARLWVLFFLLLPLVLRF